MNVPTLSCTNLVRDWSWVNKCQRTVRPVKSRKRKSLLHFPHTHNLGKTNTGGCATLEAHRLQEDWKPSQVATVAPVLHRIGPPRVCGRVTKRTQHRSLHMPNSDIVCCTWLWVLVCARVRACKSNIGMPAGVCVHARGRVCGYAQFAPACLH